MDNLTNSIDQVVQENVLPHEWPKEVLAELKNLEVKNNKRADLRKIRNYTQHLILEFFPWDHAISYQN